MNKIYQYGLCLCLLVGLLLTFTSALASPAQVGTVEKIRGKAYAVMGNAADGPKKRRLKKGSIVYVGERIQTKRRAYVTLRFSDDSVFVLGAKSEMIVDRYLFSDKGQNNSLVSRITRGSFRFISGLIAKRNPRSMQVGLGTVATIGIRGTHVGGEVRPRKDGKDASAEVMLLAPELAGKKTAIEVSNAYGRVYIDQPGYGTDIPDEKSPPSAVRKIQIRSVNNILRAVRKASLPRAVR